MHKKILPGLVLFAFFLVLGAVGARAQLEMDGTFVRMLFDPSMTGQLNTDPANGFGILFRPTTAQPFTEMIIGSTLHPGAEAWVLNLNGTLVRNGGAADFLLVGSPTVTNLDSGSLLRRNFSMTLADTPFGPPVINLTQDVSYNLDDKRVRFDVSLTNLTGVPITGLTYLRTVNPLQAFNTGASIGTDNSLGTDVFPEGLAVKSLIPGIGLNDPDQRLMALASDIKPDPATGLTTFSNVNSAGNAQSNNDIASISASGFARLNADGTISEFGPNPFQSDPGSVIGLNLWFDTIADLAPGQTANLGTFFYVFAGQGGAPVVIPEPGATALFFGAAFGGVTALWRRRRRT
jgi:hypothetical protein